MLDAIGIDIGSTATKVLVRRGGQIFCTLLMPTGWNSRETALKIQEELLLRGVDVKNSSSIVVATGYGRISVPYAQKQLTEITCHGLGGAALAGGDTTIIDIGGQDTKVITLADGAVSAFTMNDKCSAGTGRFLEIMANRMAVDLVELCMLAEQGVILPISSMCTVFAESEVIGYIGSGAAKADISAGIIDSVLSKVTSLVQRHGPGPQYLLTGGLCDLPYICRRLSEKLQAPVKTEKMCRYAGALGAALKAEQL